MDLKSIKERLKSLQSKGEKREKVDYTKYFWKPKEEGKYQIRIIPSKFDSTNPFREVFIHYGFVKYPLYSLSNWGEKDPIEVFAKQLQKQGDKESYIQGKKLEPKMRVMVPVIVRGEESAGVRLWDINKDTYIQLLNLADDEDYGDYTDITDGRDLTVTYAFEKIGNKQHLMPVRISPKVKQSPITDDDVQLNDWLENQPDILEIQIKKSYDEMKQILKDFINQSEDNDIDQKESQEDKPQSFTEKIRYNETQTTSEDDEDEEDDEEEEQPKPVKKFKVVNEDDEEGDLPWQKQPAVETRSKAEKPVTTKKNKFQDLFEDED